MKIVAIGIGQCGCNIADEFYAINNYSKSFINRKIKILTDAFAINTDETDLASLRYIPRDRRHRITMGTARTFGHGVGKVNIEGARLMKEINPVVIDDVLGSNEFYESDAVVVAASGAGGTGSGAIGWLVRELKERLRQRPKAKAKVKVEVKGKASNLKAGGRTSNLKPMRLRPQSSSLDTVAVQQYLAGGPAVKLLVQEEGWYRVTQPEIAAAGLSSTVNPRA